MCYSKHNSEVLSLHVCLKFHSSLSIMLKYCCLFLWKDMQAPPNHGLQNVHLLLSYICLRNVKMKHTHSFFFLGSICVMQLSNKKKGVPSAVGFPHCAGSGEGLFLSSKPYPHKCAEAGARTRDLPVTDGRLYNDKQNPNYRTM